ncbi:MAG: hypothetical protein AB8H47_13475 [Bacteroidia bacterium]
MHKHLLLVLLLGMSLLTACTSVEGPLRPISSSWTEVTESPIDTDLREIEEDEDEKADPALRISFYRFSFVIDWF